MKHDDIDRELDSHLAFAMDDLIRSGLTRDEARRRAMMSLGGVTQTAESYREAQRLPFV